MSADLLVVGTGLIGTSIGLALEGAGVLLHDRHAGSLGTAVARGAGTAWDGTVTAAHGVLCVPPRAVPGVLAELAGAAATWSHVASVQVPLAHALDAAGFGAVCGTHPMAGKETAGPDAATGELFVGRPWALCPSPGTATAALDAARTLALRCGAVPSEVTGLEHDAAVALVSHLPQVAASAVAAVLLVGRSELLRLAGPGLQDTTRIAASDPGLWEQILGENAAAVAPLVRALAEELTAAADALDAGDGLRELLERGNAGRALVPVKRGGTDSDFAIVGVRVADRRGQLAGVLLAAADAGIDVEDVRVEHLSGRPSGVVELLVTAAERPRARTLLTRAGWDVLT